MPQPDVVLHCDWSLNPKKRFCAAAYYTNGGWLVDATGPVPHDPLDLLKPYGQKQIFLGLDLPLGVPLKWAERANILSFRLLLSELAGQQEKWSRFFDVAEQPADIAIQRPFYPKRPGGTKLQHLIDGLNLDSAADLRRLCDQPTAHRQAAAPLFWTMGAQQVGKAAISAWQQLLIPLISISQNKVGLWPFDGDLKNLLAVKQMVIAEVYPAEMYSHVGIRLIGEDGRPTSKRSQDARKRCATALFTTAEKVGCKLSDAAYQEVEIGFGSAADGEDRFDAFVGLMGMLLVVGQKLTEGRPPNDQIREVEGWLLGLAA